FPKPASQVSLDTLHSDGFVSRVRPGVTAVPLTGAGGPGRPVLRIWTAVPNRAGETGKRPTDRLKIVPQVPPQAWQAFVSLEWWFRKGFRSGPALAPSDLGPSRS